MVINHEECRPKMVANDTYRECNKGWDSIIDPLVAQCKVEGVEILQIKEKFGGLRFYTSGASEWLESAIDAAEALSYRTCEDCGSPGSTVNVRGWVSTLCPTCRGLRRSKTGD